jgi:hypothetical protein
MQPERFGFHRSLLNLLLAGAMLCGVGQARAGDTADFLSAVVDLPVPPAVSAPLSTKPPPQNPPERADSTQGRTRSAESPRREPQLASRGKGEETTSLKRRLDKVLRENADLKRQAAGGAANDRGRDRTVANLHMQAKTLSEQLATTKQMLNAAEVAKQQAGREAEQVQGEVKRLTLLNHALSVKADVAAIAGSPEVFGKQSVMSDEFARLKARMAERQTASGAVHEESVRLKKAFAHSEEQLVTLTQRNGGLQAQLATMTQARDQLQKLMDDTRQQADLAMASVKARMETVRQERDGLSVQLAAAGQKAQSQAQTLNDLQSRLALLTNDRDTLQSTVAGLTARNVPLKTVEDDLAREKSGTDVVRQQLAATEAERDTLKKNVATLTAEMAVLKLKPGAPEEIKTSGDAQAVQKIQVLNDRVATLTSQLAEKQRGEPVLSTEAQQQTYAGGVMLSRTLLRTLNLQKNLGLDPDPTLLLAGVSDGVRGQIRLANGVLDKQYQALIGQLSSREESRYREGEKVLEKETAGRKVLKRNRTVFFVQASPGKARLKPGEQVVFDLKESVLKGRELRNNKGVKAALDERLPYLVHEALSFAGHGGVTDVYCLASDVYPPEQIPEGLYGYSLLKFTLSVSK